MTLAVEDSNSKLVEFFCFFAVVDIEDSVDNRLARANSGATASQVWQQR